MPNKNYQAGRRFEYRVKKFFEDLEYYVIRSAGSKSPFDLVAFPTDRCDCGMENNIYLIQCKYKNKITKREKEKVKSIAMDLTFFNPLVICLVAYAKERSKIEFEGIENSTFEWYNIFFEPIDDCLHD